MATIRKRLLNGYLSMMAVMLIGFGVALYLVTRWRLTMEVDADLDRRIDQFIDNMNISGNEIELEVRKADIEHDFFWQIGLPGGTIVDHSKAYVDVQVDMPAEADRVGKTNFWTSTTPQGTHMRFARREISFGGLPRTLKLVTIHLGDHMEITEKSARYTHEVATIVIDSGTNLAPRDEALNTLMIILLISVPTTLALSALGGVYLVGRALDPVVAITKAAADVGPGNLRARVPVGSERDEISRLAEVINGMLDRIAEGFQRERQFTGDASHELRTPLTVLRGDIEVSLRRTRSQEEYRQVLLRGLDEAGRMERIVEGLLFLARADAGRIKLDPTPIDLAPLLTKVAASVRRLPGSPEIRLAKLDGRMLLVRGSLNLLETLFTNLLENAVKHGNEPITMEVADDQTGWAVSVIDSGPGIPADEIPHLFDRFYRTDKARSRSTGGVGLGLSICKWITAAHSGTIAIKNGTTGGVRFTVTLPKATVTISEMPSPMDEGLSSLNAPPQGQAAPAPETTAPTPATAKLPAAGSTPGTQAV